MGKIVNIASLEAKEDKLQHIADYMGELKTALAELIEEYDSDNADEEKIDTLTEALDALEDAYDAVNDVVMEEL